MTEEETGSMEQEELAQTPTSQLSEQEENAQPVEETPKKVNSDIEDMMTKETLTEENAISPLESQTDAALDGNAVDALAEIQVGEGGNNIGRWTPQEHAQFLKGLELYGKDWRRISTIVQTRTLIQIRTHAQKFFQKNDFGTKYDRSNDDVEVIPEKRRVVPKHVKNRTHRNTYQSTTKLNNRPAHIIMTQSRTPTQPSNDSTEIQTRSKTTDEEDENDISASPVPEEYDASTELEKQEYVTMPQHFNRSLRPSSMPLSSTDHFSRRITPLGVYYPAERAKQERQFASAVLELIEKKAFEEMQEKEVESKEAIPQEPKADSPMKEEPAVQTTDKPKEEKDDTSSHISIHIHTTPTETTISTTTKDSSTTPLPAIKEEEPMRPPKSERKVSIVDIPKEVKLPSSSKFHLKLKNPESLLPLADEVQDYREDLSAPKTPANVRGNRSLLHRAILSSEKETRDFLESYHGNPNALEYFVNKPDSHGFTPLMTAACLTDGVMSLNICNMLIEQGAELSTRDREGNTVLMWAAIVGNPEILRFFIEKGGCVNDQNEEGNSPLHLAIMENRKECSLILLNETQIDINIRNSHRFTALDVLNSEACSLSPEDKKEIRKAFFVHHPNLKTIVIHHPDCNLHLPRTNGSQGNNPWEAPPRIQAILDQLKEQFDDWEIDYDTNFEVAKTEDILRAHSARYVKLLSDLNNSLEQDQSVPLTPHVQLGFGVPSSKIKDEAICDSSFSKGSLQAAMRAAGGAIHGIDKVLSGEYHNAFVCVRPPGHHAGTDGLLTTATSCGFCILNNVMIAALYALEHYPEQIKKIAIVDIDIHHGNGTEQIIRKYNHPDKILFWSSHIYFNDPHNEYEFYPGTGNSDYVNDNVYNQPLQPLWETEHSRRHDVDGGRVLFRKVVNNRLLPLIRSFSPDLIILSSGFDGGYGDVGNYRYIPTMQIGMNLKIEDYEWVLHKLVELSNLICNGHLVSLLEGGYGSYGKSKTDNEVNVTRVPFAKNVAGHVHGMLGEAPVEKEPSKKASNSQVYCGCGEDKDEEMIECSVGRKCGGWVHFSCAGIDFEDYNEEKQEPFICKWCRADGVNLKEEKKEVKEVKKEEEKEKEKERETRRRVKRDADTSYYGGYRRDNSDSDTENRRRTRKRVRYSSYGNANRETLSLDEDYQQ